MFEAPLCPSTHTVGHTVPLTVVPAVGSVMKTDSEPAAGGGGAGAGVGVGAGVGGGAGDVAPLATLIDTLHVPVLPVASRTLAVSICTPSDDSVLSYGSEIGPALAVVVDPTVRPPRLSVTLFAPPLAPLIHTTAHAPPRTVVPEVGCVIATVSVPFGGAGVGDVTELDTVTVRVALATAPAASRAVNVSVCVAFGVVVVFHV